MWTHSDSETSNLSLEYESDAVNFPWDSPTSASNASSKNVYGKDAYAGVKDKAFQEAGYHGYETELAALNKANKKLEEDRERSLKKADKKRREERRRREGDLE